MARGVFAAVPYGFEAGTVQPDPVLVASTVCPSAIFSHHTALELLGAGHSVWQVCTLICDRPPGPVHLNPHVIRFLSHPTPLVRKQAQETGVRQVEREGKTVHCTGPERTLVDGFRQPRWVGGLSELVESASGFGVPDLDLLELVLLAYDQRTLWAAVGWFLERHQERFFVPDQYLAALEKWTTPGALPGARSGEARWRNAGA